MRILATLIIFVSLCSLAYASDVAHSLVLKTGGGIFEPAFTVRLSASGTLTVTKTPTVNTPAKDFKRELGSVQRDHIFALASRSSDFAIGCGKVADGTGAGMKIIYKGSEHTFNCDNAPRWPVGHATATFLKTLNRLLPKDMQVF
jgi:hypothetical protein